MPEKTPTAPVVSHLKRSDLKVGGRYLHSNGLFTREIEAIEGDRVFWHDEYSVGECGKQVFLRLCPSVTTDILQLRR